MLKITWRGSKSADLFPDRLVQDRFVLFVAKEGNIVLASAQLAMLLEGIG